MCNTNEMDYCYYCQQWYRKDYVHTCSGMSYYYCSGCGQYVSGYHSCIGTIKFYPNPLSEPKHYKCPQCKGEFSEPAQKFTGKYEYANIEEIGNKTVISKQKTPIYKYECPFCGQGMKGLNQ